jgi:hypothetical protein
VKTNVFSKPSEHFSSQIVNGKGWKVQHAGRDDFSRLVNIEFAQVILPRNKMEFGLYRLRKKAAFALAEPEKTSLMGY